MRQNAWAPVTERKHPETFCWTRDHADIALGEAVVKRHGEVLQEGQHGILVSGETIEQIASR
jgi:hypothetical protein